MREAVRLELHLPVPPSTNDIWQFRQAKGLDKGGVGTSKRYRKWKQEAGQILNANVGWRGKVQPAEFDVARDLRVLMLLCPILRIEGGDVDNRLKAALDWMQHMAIFTNDNQVEGVAAIWAGEPIGRECRIFLWRSGYPPWQAGRVVVISDPSKPAKPSPTPEAMLRKALCS